MNLFDQTDLLFLHEPVRLQLMLALASVERLDFVYLHRSTGISKGNLSVQMSRLGERGWVISERRIRENRPCTTFEITPQGRKILGRYRRAMRQLLDSEDEE